VPFVVALCVALSVLAADAGGSAKSTGQQPGKSSAAPHSEIVHDGRPAQTEIDINRPRSPFDCELPIGEQWYGSRERCLGYLCAGQNVYNEYIFDAANRRRKNPCYGQNPTEFPGE